MGHPEGTLKGFRNTEIYYQYWLPVMIVQGSDDKLVDPSGAQVLHNLVSSGGKTVQIYDGNYHKVFNNPGYEQVLDDVGAWLETHIT